MWTSATFTVRMAIIDPYNSNYCCQSRPMQMWNIISIPRQCIQDLLTNLQLCWSWKHCRGTLTLIFGKMFSAAFLFYVWQAGPSMIPNESQVLQNKSKSLGGSTGFQHLHKTKTWHQLNGSRLMLCQQLTSSNHKRLMVFVVLLFLFNCS